MKNLTLSRRYATALFQELTSIAIKRKVVAELNDIIELSKSSSDFANIINNPTISIDDKSAVFTTLFKRKKFNSSLLRFILVLLQNNRLDLIEPACKVMNDILMSDSGEIRADVTFASKPTTAVKSSISKKIASMTGKKVIMVEVIDPTIISGVIIRYGSTLIDASVKGSVDNFIEELESV